MTALDGGEPRSNDLEVEAQPGIQPRDRDDAGSQRGERRRSNESSGAL